MNKYEVRMKAVFAFEERVIKTLTLIDVIEAADMIIACKAANTLIANLKAELFQFIENGSIKSIKYDELTNFMDVDEGIVEVSAIVAIK